MVNIETTENLLDLLHLEELDLNLFRGQSHDTPWKRVFGGQVLGQSLHAAYRTIDDDRMCHSLHGYFILPGDVSQPIIYDVDTLRDGGSFSTRRVTARQKGRAIFIMAASFHKKKDGLTHQIDMPDVPDPDTLKTDVELMEGFKQKFPDLYRAMRYPRPIEFRPVQQMDPLSPAPSDPIRQVWLRCNGALPDEQRIHQEVLTYASDYSLLTTALLPHRDVAPLGSYFLASLDHAMWFHRDFRADEWLLYSLDSPSASNSRGFTRGNIFDQQGRLVASVTQEGLMAPLRL